MSERTFHLTEETSKDKLAMELCLAAGGCREPSIWREKDCHRVSVKLKGEFGFLETFSIRMADVGFLDEWLVPPTVEDVLKVFDKAWEKWEAHLKRLKAIDRIADPQPHDLALAEIAERHLQGRAPYHVTWKPSDSAYEAYQK